jgi:hypothetical protein
VKEAVDEVIDTASGDKLGGVSTRTTLFIAASGVATDVTDSEGE